MKEAYNAPAKFEIFLKNAYLKNNKISVPQTLKNFKNFIYDEIYQIVSFQIKDNTTSVEYKKDEVGNFTMQPIYTSTDSQIPLFERYFHEANSNKFSQADFISYISPIDGNIQITPNNQLPVTPPSNVIPTNSDNTKMHIAIAAGIALILILSKSKKRKKRKK